MSSLVPVSYQQLTRFLPGEKQYLILAITLYRVGTCISSMPPPSPLVNTHHSYESIILSSYSLATCFFWVCLIIRYYGLNVPCQQGVLVFVSYSYDLWHRTVLWGTKMSYAFLLIMDGAPSHMSSGQNH